VALLDRNDIVVDRLLSNESGEVKFDVGVVKYFVEINKDGFIFSKKCRYKTTRGV
jgi:hypothetical protein